MEIGLNLEENKGHDYDKIISILNNTNHGDTSRCIIVYGKKESTMDEVFEQAYATLEHMLFSLDKLKQIRAAKDSITDLRSNLDFDSIKYQAKMKENKQNENKRRKH